MFIWVTSVDRELNEIIVLLTLSLLCCSCSFQVEFESNLNKDARRRLAKNWPPSAKYKILENKLPKPNHRKKNR